MKIVDARLDDSNKSCVDILLHGIDLSDGNFEAQELQEITSNVSVRLTGLLQKNDVVNRLVG